MGDRLLRIYHRLPSPARTWAASLRGFYLRSWRYGAESDELVAATLERESWSPDRWQDRQAENLAYLLHRAATRVPYYREYWSKRRQAGDQSSWEELENWPILLKEAVRERPGAFLADDCDRKRMFPEHTSGTSGKPLDLWWSRETARLWYALFEARARHWHGVSRREPWAILGGQPIAPAYAAKPPFWVWNAPMNQLYLSANHLKRENIPAYLKALEEYGVTHLITYSSSAALFARETAELNLQAKGIQVVITNAEPLFPWQREAIQQGLGCAARETYGMAEIAAAASECAAGRLHLWPEAGRIEVLRDDEDSPAGANEAGRLICTGLINADMPLVRYAVGDRIRPAAWNAQCSCGRTLPLIDGIEGRVNDLLIAPDGRRVYWLNPVFYGLPVRESQIIQETLTEILVRFSPAPEFTKANRQTIIDRLRARMGEVEVRLEEVAQIPRGANNKFQAVVCKVR